MNMSLNITNGDSAVQIMKKAGITGSFLPWRDLLHEGPVPAGLTLKELSAIRAEYIISQGWGTPESIKKSFTARDRTLLTADRYPQITLWFEHDLYDQLQLLQILDWFADHQSTHPGLKIICSEQYLALATLDQIKELSTHKENIESQHLDVAQKSWAAFRSASPFDWYHLLDENTSVLPFLNGAVLRILEEYPSCHNGLSRTAQKALEVLVPGELHPWTVFERYQATEKRRFMGDSSFWRILNELLQADTPLLRCSPGDKLEAPFEPEQRIAITSTGKNVLAGNQHWLDMTAIDCWIGGVHLTTGTLWCWDSHKRTLVTGKNA